MILDSQAIEHLELIEDHKSLIPIPGVNQNTAQKTLFHYIDHTKTDFGKRLLKKWLLAPLVNIEMINERLDAIEDLNS